MIKKAGLIGCLLMLPSIKADAIFYSHSWYINDLLKANTEIIHLTGNDGRSLKKIERKQLIYLYSVAEAMQEVAETNAYLFIIDGGRHANAAAGKTDKIRKEPRPSHQQKYRNTYIQGSDKNTACTSANVQKNYILINFKMLELFGTDVHIMAALIGHELAHLKLDHGAEHKGKPPHHEQSFANARYRRNNEREADYLGIIWAVEAGYDPQGAIRLRDNPMRKKSACRGYCISHPLSVERIMKSKALARRLSRDN